MGWRGGSSCPRSTAGAKRAARPGALSWVRPSGAEFWKESMDGVALGQRGPSGHPVRAVAWAEMRGRPGEARRAGGAPSWASTPICPCRILTIDPVSGRAGTQTQACLTLRQTGGPPATSGLQMGFFLASTVGFCCFFVFSPN